MRRYELPHDDDYPKDTTRRIERAWDFEIVINNDRECTKAIRLPTPSLARIDTVAINTDAVRCVVTSTDIVSAITRAHDIANDAWKDQADNDVIAPCA